MAHALPCSSGTNLSPSCSSLSSPSQTKLKTINSFTSSSRLQNFDDLIEEIESNHSEGQFEASDVTSLPDIDYPLVEPIIIRGNGNMTLFGLSNTFSTEFPNCLIAMYLEKSLRQPCLELTICFVTIIQQTQSC